MTQDIRRFIQSLFFPALASAGMLTIALLLSPLAHGGARPHQNFDAPMQCAALLSGTPGFSHCMAGYEQPVTGTIAYDTPLRPKPDPYSDAAGTLVKGTHVLVLDRVANGFWLHVQSGDLEGYVPFEALN